MQIDIVELGKTLETCMLAKGESQTSLSKLFEADDDGPIPQTFISQVKLGKWNADKEGSVEKVQRLAEVLGFKIPYVANGDAQEDLAEEETQEVSASRKVIPRHAAFVASTVNRDYSQDPETDTIALCYYKIAALPDIAARTRTVEYLCRRFLDVPFKAHED